jgi:mRNA interferase HigB
MHVISKQALKDFSAVHSASQGPLEVWYKIVKSTNFADFFALNQTFPSADQVAPFTIFDIGGNKWRIVAALHYNRGKLFIRHVFTHAEYDSWCEENRTRKSPLETRTSAVDARREQRRTGA